MSALKEDEDAFIAFIHKIRIAIKYLKSRWLTIMICALIFGTIGFLNAFFKKPVYTATLSFTVEDQKPEGGLGLSGIASQFGFDIGGGGGSAFSGSNLIELMKARSLVEKTLLDEMPGQSAHISLADYFVKLEKWNERFDSKPGLKQINFPINGDRSHFSIAQDSILWEIYQVIIKSNLEVSQKDKKSTIISVDVKSTDPLFAKSFAEALIKEVTIFYVETKSKKSTQNVLILERQADSIRRELNSSISGVAAANDQIYNLNPAYNIKRVPSTRRQVDVQANGAILTELVKNLELAKVTLRKETPLIQVVDEPRLPLPKDRQSRSLSLLAGLIIGTAISSIVLLARKILKASIK